MTIFVCLPCYNEAQNLKWLTKKIDTVLRKIHRTYKILVCDDGSTDETEQVLESLEELPIEVVKHDANMGLAEAYRSLIKHIRRDGRRNDIAIILDAERTHDPLEMVNMILEIEKGYDVVVCSRYKGGNLGVSLHRRFLSKAINWLIRNIASIPIFDCTSGFRAYKVKVLKKLPPLKSKGFEVSAEVLVNIARNNPPEKIAEIPFVLHYYRKSGKSKINLHKTVWAYISLLWRSARLDFTPFIRKAIYRIPYIGSKLGKFYDKDPILWNDGLLALAVTIMFFIYEKLVAPLVWHFSFPLWAIIMLVSFCIQHFLRRFWIFNR